MRLGTIHLQDVPWTDPVREVGEAEQAGVDVAYVADHLTHPTMRGEFLADAWTTLGALATTTSSVELGTLVAAASFRAALPLARAAATLQDVSRGRFALGPEEYWALLAEHGRQVDAACERAGTDPGRLRRSLLLGYGTVRPVESPATFRACLDRAEQLGFDEVVVYWPRGPEGTRFWADPDVFRSCLARR